MKGLINGDDKPDAIYIWNGLTLFDNADSSGATNPTAANYSALLSSIDALGGKFDPILTYKFVNRADGQILAIDGGSNQAGAMLNTATDTGNPSLGQQWSIVSNNDGYLQITSLNPGSGSTKNVLDDSAASSVAGNAIVQSPANVSTEEEWALVSAGGGYFNVVNHLSGLVMNTAGGTGSQTGFVVQETANGGARTQQWQMFRCTKSEELALRTQHGRTFQT